MGREIHYEVFKRVGARGGWTLHDVRNDREISLSLAKELMATDQATGVKVVKETYNDDTGDYLTLKIFEDGHNQMKIEPAQEEADGLDHAGKFKQSLLAGHLRMKDNLQQQIAQFVF